MRFLPKKQLAKIMRDIKKLEKPPLETLKIGEYMPCETVIKGENNKVVTKTTWEVRTDKDSWFACDTRIEAEMLSHLVQIKNLLKKGRK